MNETTLRARRFDKIDFEALDLPEQVEWKRHRELLLTVRSGETGYRGVAGMGVAVEAATQDAWREVGDKLFMPNSCLKWLFLTDIPGSYFRSGSRSREIHWATARTAAFRYGMPCLLRGSEGHEAWDFRTLPYDRAPLKEKDPDGSTREVSAGPDILSPSERPQLFRAFNRIELAMSSSAFMFRESWRPKRHHMFEYLGLPYEADKKVLCYGPGIVDHVERPDTWMPRPYICFPEKARVRLFDRATRPGMLAEPLYPEGLKKTLLDALPGGLAYKARFAGKVQSSRRENYHGLPVVVLRLVGDRGESASFRVYTDARFLVPVGGTFKQGQQVVRERIDLPDGWADKHWKTRWDRWVHRVLKGNVDTRLRIWFEREMYDLVPGFVHVSGALASPAALGCATDDHLFWDMTPAMTYYCEEVDTFVFPSLQLACWHQLVGELPGDVAVDITPADSRFVPPKSVAPAYGRPVHKDVAPYRGGGKPRK